MKQEMSFIVRISVDDDDDYATVVNVKQIALQGFHSVPPVNITLPDHVLSNNEIAEYIREKVTARLIGFSNDPFSGVPGGEGNNWEIVG